jgi:putative drug exporter of the RND superfamily
VLAALTLLPAVLGFVGHNIDRLRVPFVGKGAAGRSPLWDRWGHTVQRHPIITGGAALTVLIVLAMPLFGMRYGFPDASTGSKALTSRRAYDLTASEFGPGVNGPLVIAVDLPAGTPESSLDRLMADARATEGVAAVLAPQFSANANAAAIVVVPTTGPQDVATERLIRHLRADVVPPALQGTGAHAYVGGSTASFVDEGEYMGPRLWWFIGAVVTLSFILLLCVFRAPLVALKAAVMNLLSIGAAFGVIAVAAQGGWLGNLIGISEPTPVPVFLPVLMFAVLFGLSMDYEVFLLSRVREEYVRTRDNREAVSTGIAVTGRVITAAAAIMVMVFGAYVFEDGAMLKMVGLGLATAVLVDATVVRMVLVPATMDLLGDRNWWMPRWLDRVLPHLDVEGHHGEQTVLTPQNHEVIEEPQDERELVSAAR